MALVDARCAGCLYCREVCPYGAISAVPAEQAGPGQGGEGTVAQVNPALCQGCGSCTVVCRPGAVTLQGFTDQQIVAEVEALCLKR